MTRTLLAATLLGLFAAPVLAQPAPAPGSSPVPAPAAQPGGTPASIVRTNADGTLVRLPGVLDIEVLKTAVLDDATRAAIAPRVHEFARELELVVVDNADMLEILVPPTGQGLLETLDPSDAGQMKTMASIVTQLMSAGQLVSTLENEVRIDHQRSAAMQTQMSQYLNMLMRDRMREQGFQLQAPPQDPAAMTRYNLTQTRFLYWAACRDALTAYDQMLARFAPSFEQALDVLPPEAKSKATSAMNGERTPLAAKRALATLDVMQKRDVLSKALEFSPTPAPLGK